MITIKHHLKVLSFGSGEFRTLKNTSVLLYWPHGFGDWVFLSYIIPFLDKSNKYFVTRFGDDTVFLMDGIPNVFPVFTGCNAVHSGDGLSFGIHNFNMNLEFIDKIMEVELPLSIYEICVKNNITTLLWSHFPEVYGSRPFPYHTKSRNSIKVLSAEINEKLLYFPLQSSINFSIPDSINQYLESIVINSIGLTSNKKLCLINRTGYSSTGKNWGHRFREELSENSIEGQESRDFIKIMKKKDASWIFISMEDKILSPIDSITSSEDNCFSFFDIFKDCKLSFSTIMVFLVNRANLMVGVPSGPYSLAEAKTSLPCIGIWIDHVPSWYYETKKLSVSLLSKNIFNINLLNRPGSFLKNDHLEYYHRISDKNIISGEMVAEASEMFY